MPYIYLQYDWFQIKLFSHYTLTTAKVGRIPNRSTIQRAYYKYAIFEKKGKQRGSGKSNFMMNFEDDNTFRMVLVKVKTCNVLQSYLIQGVYAKNTHLYYIFECNIL